MEVWMKATIHLAVYYEWHKFIQCNMSHYTESGPLIYGEGGPEPHG